MTSSQVVRFPEEQPIVGKDLNRLIDWQLGNNGAQRRWIGWDGDLIDPTTGASISSGNFSDIVQNTAGNHASVRHSAGSTDTPADQVWGVTDAAAYVGRGKELRLYNTAGNNEGSFRHSGTNGHIRTDDSLQVAVALNVGSAIVATGAGTFYAQGAAQLASTLVVNGLFTVQNALGTVIPLVADPTNNRTLVGTSTPFTSAANDTFTVAGQSYFAPVSAGDAAIGLRRSIASSAGWLIGVSAAADLLFVDDGGTQTFRVGDAASTYQAVVTGDFNVTDDATITGDLLTGGPVYIGDTSNANVTLGLTINQGAADDTALALKSSDVAHGITTIAETDTFGALEKADATTGGLGLFGYTEGIYAVYLRGSATTEDTTRSTAGLGHVVISGYTKGTGGTATTIVNPGANVNIVAFRAGSNTRAVLDSDGDWHLDSVSANNVWDDHDDLSLAVALRHLMIPDRGYATRVLGDFVAEHAQILHDTGVVTLNADGHHFLSVKGALGLSFDLSRQIAARVASLERRFLALEAAGG